MRNHLLATAVACGVLLMSPPSTAQIPITDVNSDWPWLAVLNEVMQACNEKDLAKVFLDTPRTFKTSAEGIAFKDSNEYYARLTRTSSRCWSKERWQRYVVARLPLSERISLVVDTAEKAR